MNPPASGPKQGARFALLCVLVHAALLGASGIAASSWVPSRWHPLATVVALMALTVASEVLGTLRQVPGQAYLGGSEIFVIVTVVLFGPAPALVAAVAAVAASARGGRRKPLRLLNN